MAQPRIPNGVLLLTNLIPKELDAWMTRHNVGLAILLGAIKKKSADIEQAVSLDRTGLTQVPNAIGNFVCPEIRTKPPLSLAALTELKNLFKAAQILKVEADAIRAKETAAKKDDPAALTAKISAALHAIPGIVCHQGDSDFYLGNLQQLFYELLGADEVSALSKFLTKEYREEKDLAVALIRLAQIEDSRLRQQHALSLIPRT